MKRSNIKKLPYVLAVLSSLALAAPEGTDKPMTGDKSKSDKAYKDTTGGTTDTGRTGTMGSDTGTMGSDTSGARGATGKTDMLSRSDKEFIKDATNIGTAEVKLSQLAVDKATNPEVKKFAQTMVDDHSKANEELKSLVGKIGSGGVATTGTMTGRTATDESMSGEQLSSEGQKAYDKLKDLSGDKFDREYVKIMVDDHQKAVKLFEKQSKNGENSELKTFATKTLPTLRHHLDQAQLVQRDIKGRM